MEALSTCLRTQNYSIFSGGICFLEGKLAVDMVCIYGKFNTDRTEGMLFCGIPFLIVSRGV